jgi:phospholipid-translocating ATPase
MEGLRTLVVGQKVMTIDEYENWSVKYKKALNDYERGDYLSAKVKEELESNLECLGVTGVEDKLQDDVEKTIGSLRGAGIQVWMLTGDKVETATCISISTGLKSRSHRHYFMKEMHNVNEVEYKLKEVERFITTSCLMIDGHTLDICMSNKRTEAMFFDVACRAPVVCVCRCSPTQKAIITQKVIKYTGKRVACVGDGGNDVGMILESHVGIGIVGKEGKQASLAGDFSINQFSYLKKLLLWHGRQSYKRSALLSQFVIHRGLIISVIQAVFSIVFYFVSIPIYNGYLMLGYATVYTSMPVFSIVLDEDTGVRVALDYPPLYKTLQKGRALSLKTFLLWVWKSIFQGGLIMFSCITFFNDSFANIVTITFSSLIIVELLNVYSVVNKFNWKMLIASSFTLIIYIISIYSFRSYFNTSYIDGTFLWKIVVITVASWLPLHVGKLIFDCVDPPEQKKILQGKSYN